MATWCARCLTGLWASTRRQRVFIYFSFSAQLYTFTSTSVIASFIFTALSRPRTLVMRNSSKYSSIQVDKPAFHDADTDSDSLGRKDVGVSGESVSVWASWNAGFTKYID